MAPYLKLLISDSWKNSSRAFFAINFSILKVWVWYSAHFGKKYIILKLLTMLFLVENPKYYLQTHSQYVLVTLNSIVDTPVWYERLLEALLEFVVSKMYVAWISRMRENGELYLSIFWEIIGVWYRIRPSYYATDSEYLIFTGLESI